MANVRKKSGLSEQTDSVFNLDAEGRRRRKDRPIVKKEKHPLESVPAFQRPLDASTNDKPTGNIDETGAIEYRTALGNTYFVRRNPDQRTTRTKIEEDILPAIKKYLADPTAPTADQAIAAAKAIAGDAWETLSIPGDLLSGEKGASDVTLGEVFELTGGTAAASTMFDVPGGRDTLRIFGGANAKNPPNMTGYGSIDSIFNAEADFKTLENLSVDFENDPTGSLVRVMDELERNPNKYPATLKEVVAGKWFRGRDDLMRFEIDDSQSEILGNGVGDIVRMDEDDMDAYLRGFSFNVDNKFPDNSIQGMPEEQAFSTLGNILKHDELYNQYPQLRDAPVIEDTAYFKRNPNVLGYFDDSSGTIAINTNKITTNEELRDTLLHEVQHLVQHLEGFESGTNVHNADVLVIKKAIEGSPEYQKAFTDYSAKVSDYLQNRDAATVAVYNKNKEVASKVLDIILDDFSNKTEIPVEEIYERLTKGETFDQIKMSVSPDIRARGFVYPPEFERILHIAEGNVGGMAPSSSVDLNRSLDDVNPRESAAPYFEMLSGKDKIDLVADNNRWQQNRLSSTISSLIKDNPELAKDFENSLGFSAQDFIDASRSQDSVGKLYGIPDVVPPTKPKIVRNYVIYSTKRGEVEARNVSARKDMPASERTPENVFDTEDTPANRQWGEPELKKARAGQNPVTGFANGPSASESYRENPNIKLEVEKAFEEVANTQRGNPELAMVEAQKIYGGGVMPNALEHIGDLTHRMAERGGRFGAEYVAPKVTRMLDSLLSDYGFEKEMLENIQSNARFKYERDNPDIPFEQYKKEYENKIDKALKKYSEAHKKVPVYNQMQLAGREAAIAIGEKRYTDAIEQLYIIDQAIKDGRYKQLALEFDPDIDFRKKEKEGRPLITGFKTGRGSTYKVEDGSRTTRERAPDEVGGEVVTQPTSGKTIYMSYRDMEKFGPLFQKGEPGLYQFVPIKDQQNKAQLVFTKDYGPNKAGDPVPNTQVSFTTEPKVGDHPVEIYESTNNNRVSIHFGNEITEVFDDKKPRQFAEGGSPRPKLRPKGFANATSPRPRLRPSEDEVRYVDAVFRGEDGDIITSPEENNPVTMLGLIRGDTFRQYPNELNIYGAYLKPSDTAEGGPHKSKLQDLYAREKPDSPPLLINDILIAGKQGVENRYTAAHEFMHRGFNVLRSNHSFDEVKERFGPATAQILFSENNPRLEHALVQSILEKEGKIAGIDYTSKDYLKGVSKEIRDKLDKSVEDIYELSNETLGETGYQTDRDRGPTTRQGRRGAKPKSFWSFITEKLGFAEGGAVGNMNEQMSFAFEDGGLRDDGMMRDPVSGNEVPPGSTAKEVRDDIPAQLSEGEYVVPADVVRYYGVKFFEDLRDNAKMGLQDMEARGRIGGEPVPAGGPQAGGDLTPEEMAVLQELGMAEGGVVNMYKQQQDLYTAPNQAVGNSMNMATGGTVPGYAPGGLQPAAQQTQDQIYAAGQQAQQAGFTGFPLGSTVFPTQAQLAQGQTTPSIYGTSEPEESFVAVTLINTNPPYDITIATTQEEYDSKIAEGYVVDDGSFTPPVMGSDDDGGTPPPPGESKPAFSDWATDVDWNSEDSIRSFVDSIKKGDVDPITGKLAQGAGYMLAGIPGAIAGAALTDQGFLESVSNLRASQLLAKAKGFEDLSASIEKDIDSMLEGKSGITKFLANVFARGTGRKTGVIETGRIDLTTPKPSATPVTPAVEPTPSDDDGFTPGDGTRLRDTGTNIGDKAASIQEEAAKTGKSIAEIGRERAPSTAETQTDVEEATGGQGNQGKGSGAGGMNKGGLMATPKKKAKRQYKKGGLANKK